MEAGGQDLAAWERRGVTPRHKGPGISTAWLASMSPDERLTYQDGMVLAWDALCDQEQWREWYRRWAHELKPRPGGNYLAIEDRDRRYCRITRAGRLDWHIPVSELREADDPVAYLTGLLVELLTRRAGRAGVEAPPGVVPTAGG